MDFYIKKQQSSAKKTGFLNLSSFINRTHSQSHIYTHAYTHTVILIPSLHLDHLQTHTIFMLIQIHFHNYTLS